MGDFLIDFRPRERRQLASAAEFLKFYPDMQSQVWDFPEAGVVLTSADNPALWDAHTALDGRGWIGLCGRISLSQAEWDEAARIEGAGGLACKFIHRCYRQGGLEKVAALSGNFVILIFDGDTRKFHLLTDRWGLMPAFKYEQSGALVCSSHPDALADAVGESRNWDLTSFAEFILTGKVGYPASYYRQIRSLPFGAITTIAPGPGGLPESAAREYFKYYHAPRPEGDINLLAEEFAAGFRKSITQRTLPLLGTSAIALSGGLDSRTVLAASPGRDRLLSFSCYDVENEEFQIARTLAAQAGAKFVPLRRSFDYYGDQAAIGARISAGMGCIASNHFLGFRNELQNLGVQNLLTGCYCDYAFKGLALNKTTNPWTTREGLGAFDYSFYTPLLDTGTELSRLVRERLSRQFPAELRGYDSDDAVFGVEQRRLFPLVYEEDNAERTIPQRTMGWYVPLAENDLMAVHLKMSISMRLNRKLFKKMTALVCGPGFANIPDANTGSPVNCSIFREAVSSHVRRAERFLRKFRRTNATSGSWLNWHYYVNNSRVVRELWSAPNPDATAVFKQVLGDAYQPEISAYGGRRISVFLQLFTLKLWFDQRQLRNA